MEWQRKGKKWWRWKVQWKSVFCFMLVLSGWGDFQDRIGGQSSCTIPFPNPIHSRSQCRIPIIMFNRVYNASTRFLYSQPDCLCNMTVGKREPYSPYSQSPWHPRSQFSYCMSKKFFRGNEYKAMMLDSAYYFLPSILSIPIPLLAE